MHGFRYQLITSKNAWFPANNENKFMEI